MTGRLNPKGWEAPLGEWTHADLVSYMCWQIITGMTSGQQLQSTVFQFPQLVLQWSKDVEALAQTQKGKKK